MKISVVLTSYNHEKFLRESIESVLNQTYQEYELIIVDDCSTDGSWSIIEEYKEAYAYKKIITIRHEYNWGGGGIRDAVNNYATGNWIAIHHSDDVWALNKLEKQVRYIQENPECVAVFTNANAIDEEGVRYQDKEGFYYNLFSDENHSRYEWLNYFFYHGNCLCHPSILAKREIYSGREFSREGFKQIPDLVKWIRICKKYEIYVLKEPLVSFRVHKNGENTSGLRIDTQIRSTIELYLMLDEYAAIKDREEFRKIFPEAEEWCKGPVFVPEYALGMLCTREGMPPYTRLFGIQQLYKALNCEITALAMKEQYHYTVRQFKEENGKYDIFSVLPYANLNQKRTLYLDYGNGWRAEDSVAEQFLFGPYLSYKMSFTLKNSGCTSVHRLRFDPAEAEMIKNKIVDVRLNGRTVKYYPENSIWKEDGFDIFTNLDPQYVLWLPDKIAPGETMEICIEGIMNRLSDEDISRYTTQFMINNRSILSQIRRRLRYFNRALKW